MDTFLKIWAIVGPILTAAVSAVWARHVQEKDRAHQIELSKVARQSAIEDRNSQYSMERERIFASEIKTAFSAFLSAVHQYAEDMSTAISSKSGTNDRNPSDASKRLHEAYAAAAMVGNTTTSKACYALCSAAAHLPGSGENGKFSESAMKTFVEARQDFVAAAHTYLESLAKA